MCNKNHVDEIRLTITEKIKVLLSRFESLAVWLGSITTLTECAPADPIENEVAIWRELLPAIGSIGIDKT